MYKRTAVISKWHGALGYYRFQMLRRRTPLQCLGDMPLPVGRRYVMLWSQMECSNLPRGGMGLVIEIALDDKTLVLNAIIHENTDYVLVVGHDMHEARHKGHRCIIVT